MVSGRHAYVSPSLSLTHFFLKGQTGGAHHKRAESRKWKKGRGVKCVNDEQAKKKENMEG